MGAGRRQPMPARRIRPRTCGDQRAGKSRAWPATEGGRMGSGPCASVHAVCGRSMGAGWAPAHILVAAKTPALRRQPMPAHRIWPRPCGDQRARKTRNWPATESGRMESGPCASVHVPDPRPHASALSGPSGRDGGPWAVHGRRLGASPYIGSNKDSCPEASAHSGA